MKGKYMASKKQDGITRRDFMGGVALSLTAGTMLSPMQSLAMASPSGNSSQSVNYPPALTGLRGSHVGSFETAHAVSWEGRTWPNPKTQTDETYDLIVVGGGLSGLASAHLYQKKNPQAKILILDNHDDFGGHAKRNEFQIGDKHVIGYGGSQSIDSPKTFSPQSKQILQDLGIKTERFNQYFDRNFNKKHKLGRTIFFDKAKYGENVMAESLYYADEEKIEDIVNNYPLSKEGKKSLIRLYNGEEDYLPNMSMTEKITLLRSISYEEFIVKYAKMPEEVAFTIRNIVIGLWGVGMDALSALEGFRMEMFGFEGLEIDVKQVPHYDDHYEPYIYHFPEGNAGVARLLVRKLIPSIADGSTMEDIVLAKFDYQQLDKPTSNVRIRLLSTAIKAVNNTDGKSADVTYIRDEKVERVQGNHVIMACYNNILPHICPDIGEEQKEALNFPQKVPLAYINIALTNWRAFKKAGCNYIYYPSGLLHSLGLDFPVSMGGYDFAKSPDDPILVHATHTPTRPNEGLSALEQHRLGRHDMYNMSFDDYEKAIKQQMNDALGPYGFDAEKDITTITVNRWPHGYAYEYNELWEPWDWLDGKADAPHIKGRAQLGRISIANSDAESFAYVNGAFDAAHRAVEEQSA